jgi:hypothetical protein
MAQDDPNLDAGEGPDLSFIPDTFKGDDGSIKVDDYTAHYNDLVTFKSQADEAAASAPKDASEYAWAVGEDFQWAEGFDPAAFPQPVLDDKGQPVIGDDGKPATRPMDVSDLLAQDDPDLPLLQEAMFKAGAKPELMGEIAKILVNREIGKMSKAGEEAANQMKALGPEGKARLDTLTRSVKARLPEAQAKALMDDITSADTLRALEAILKPSSAPPGGAPTQKIDNATASIDDRIMAGLQKRA